MRYSCLKRMAIQDRIMASHHEITEHKHGSMDISAQRATFSGFIKGTTWVSGLAIVVLIFMALANS